MASEVSNRPNHSNSWNPYELIALGFTQNEIAEASGQPSNTSIIDRLVEQKWQGGVPASDQFEISKLREREVEAITDNLLNDLIAPVLTQIVQNYLRAKG